MNGDVFPMTDRLGLMEVPLDLYPDIPGSSHRYPDTLGPGNGPPEPAVGGRGRGPGEGPPL